ncbi:MAG: hypothetical protein ABSH01_01025 [Terriglobia bacterium]
MENVKDLEEVCWRLERCPSGGIIKSGEPSVTLHGKKYNVECAEAEERESTSS